MTVPFSRASEISPFDSRDQVRVDQRFTIAIELIFKPSDIVEPFSIVGAVYPARTYFIAKSVLANLTQFGPDGFGPRRIACRFDDWKVVEALADRL